MPQAFLSYTHKDDEFFGGYITAFRKMLENAVHVVTGDGSFRVFQDVEGLVLGDDWQKKLDEMVHESSFFVPMLSPLYFSSEACRDEATKFLAHESELGREDLVLPIYFLTTARLEKAEEKAKDPLATEIATRQWFDWREQANVPLQDPTTRAAMLKLAGAVGTAIGRLDEAPSFAAAEAHADDPGLTADVAPDLRRGTPSARTILWVDDHPDNNVWERRALESYGIRFTIARDTAEALHALQAAGRFEAIISDMGRAGDPQAGLSLLAAVRDRDLATPYFIYTAGLAAHLGPLARMRGARGLTANPDALVAMVLAAIR